MLHLLRAEDGILWFTSAILMDGTNASTEQRRAKAAFVGFREREVVLLLCLAAAIRVFIFSAAFPFFNNVDEQMHFDLAVKYAQGRVPRSLVPLSGETVPFIVLYGSPEYFGMPTNFPGGRFPPPPGTQPVEKIRGALAAEMASWHAATNFEAAQPPLYYALAGAWWRAGQAGGFDGGPLLYWLRFLNVPLAVALVWLCYAAARMVFPDNIFPRLGAPALLAFLPQTTFYSVQNDALAPLVFGAAFVFLVRWARAEIPGVRLGAVAGLTLAASFLVKNSGLPLLAVAAAAVLLKIFQLAKAGKLRPAIPAVTALAVCAGLPMALWMAWCKINFGDFTGTATKIRFLDWTRQPFAEWWQHPIFTPHGLWTFWSGLLATFWQGEMLWHRQPLASPAVDAIYAVLSIIVLGAAVVALWRGTPGEVWRRPLWLGFWCFAASVAFLGFLSVIYDFHDCFYPSRAHPYFTSGRLMLGALIPFLLLFLFGLDFLLGKAGATAKFFALGALVVFMLTSEIAVNWPVFFSPYNWFHM